MRKSRDSYLYGNPNIFFSVKRFLSANFFNRYQYRNRKVTCEKLTPRSGCVSGQSLHVDAFFGNQRFCKRARKI